MDNPAEDLVVLKQICKELQEELAFAMPDVEKVAMMADEVRYLADCIGTWARKQ